MSNKMLYSFCMVTLIVSCLINTYDAARILAIFPMPAISHQSTFRPITQELAKRGHEVTVITPNPAFLNGQTPKNLREIDVHDITYGIWKEYMTKFSTGNTDVMYNQLKMVMELFIKYSEVQLMAPEVQALVNNKNETFDLLLVEHCIRPVLVFSHFFKIPVISISSLGALFETFESVGAPNHPILYPLCIRQRIFDLTMWEKMNAFYEDVLYKYMSYYHEEEENIIIRKIFGKNIPTIAELRNNVAMVFLNVHPIWEDNHPVPPNVIYMGGVHQKPKTDLPEDLKSQLDSSKHGVIYFSLGTSVNASALPPARIQAMVNVFSKLPYDIIWKFDKEDMPEKPSNVILQKWLPQADLLRHPKVKLFIMQGGLQSTDEAITAGVPVITIPILGDQWYNAERHVYHKIGVKLDLETMTEEIFKNAIDTVIDDESYRRNIEKLRAVMHDQPLSPLDRAVWWTEHVLRHGGGKHLRSPAANMPWTQYYEMKLVSVVLISLLSAVLLVVYAVYSVWRYIKSNFMTSIKTKKS